MEESTNSSEEMVDQETSNIDLGVGRSYECVFCKRGFNTAQALGGHMNIHRKDRARNKPNSTKQFMQETPRLLHQIMPSSSNIRRVQPHDQALSYPATSYFPAADASSNYSTLYESNYYQDRDDHDHRDRQEPVSMISGDWRLRLSLEVEDLEKNRLNQEKELDLELRLGL